MGICVEISGLLSLLENKVASKHHSKHYAAQVLYQDTLASPSSKPSVSSTGLLKSSYPSKDELPCQVVPPIHKPTTKPALPSDFPLVKNCSASADIISLAEKAVEESVKTEFVVSLASCGLPYGTATTGSLPPWGGIHALITSHDVPLMHVGFLPVILSQVTVYATVQKLFKTFRHVESNKIRIL